MVGPGSWPGERTSDRSRIRVVDPDQSADGQALTCAYWEAFCEDLAAEALDHFAEHAQATDHLPSGLKKTILKSLSTEGNELAIWAIAGDGWRTVLRQRADELRGDEDRSLNTPKTAPVREFFNRELGLKNVTKAWSWHKNPVARTTDRLDKLVVLRGSIAHRGAPLAGSRSPTPLPIST